MIDQGIRLSFISWLRSFCSDRRARVKLNNVFSKSYIFSQGLPQGSVLAPLLFLFYINDLANKLPDDILNALFADDVTLLATERETKDAEAKVQNAVNIVNNWSKEWKISLNADKSETSGFSVWTNDNHEKWTPKITLGNKTLKDNPTPRLLGVILDRMLTFKPHLLTVKDKLQQSLRASKSVAHTEWG